MSIDLIKPFCSRSGIIIYHTFLRAPWREGDFVYASDASIIARLPVASVGADSIPDESGLDKGSSLFAKHYNASAEFVPLPHPLPEIYPCECGGALEDCDCFFGKRADRNVLVGKTYYGSVYLHMIASLPGVEWSPNHGYKVTSTLGMFRFDGGGEGLLMSRTRK